MLEICTVKASEQSHIRISKRKGIKAAVESSSCRRNETAGNTLNNFTPDHDGTSRAEDVAAEMFATNMQTRLSQEQAVRGHGGLSCALQTNTCVRPHSSKRIKWHSRFCLGGQLKFK